MAIKAKKTIMAWGALMSGGFVGQNPVLNSPYKEPSRHFRLNDDGTPTDVIEDFRRPHAYLVPIPKAKRQKGQAELDLEVTGEGGTRLTQNDFINQLRSKITAWRQLAPDQWGVTHETYRLLSHWRDSAREQPLFFCQVEAVETIIYLTEVEPQLQKRIKEFNAEANPDLFRIAMKMATGTGKTMVMAMLIAWQAINKSRHRNSRTYTDAFLVVTPGITIRDRLRVILPSDPENYYEKRNLVPRDMLDDIKKALIVISNYHQFKLRETIEAPKLTKALLAGRDENFSTTETEGEMVSRVCKSLMGRKNIIVLNDEAHHCYRHKLVADDEKPAEKLDAEEKEEIKKQDEAARVWISGIEAVSRILGVSTVYDLSATPFFLRGSGYQEGTLFPWVVSDFSLMDAIESGIVKIPRVPVSDNQIGEHLPIYRNLWENLKKSPKSLPRKGRTKQGENLNPEDLPSILLSALEALYHHYEKVAREWEIAGQPQPPVFIVVCSNTSVSKLVNDFIAGYEKLARNKSEFEITSKDAKTFTVTDKKLGKVLKSDIKSEKDADKFIDEYIEALPKIKVDGRLALFRNIENGQKVSRPRTLLIDSEQLESGEGLDADFKKVVADEIDDFKRELRERFQGRDVEKITDEDILREVMNTVGRQGKLGESIRCVVSVSMLTEGWDANTVTHVLGVRAFGTQLLCEQVVGRALRRVSYEPGEDGLMEPEYADILGVPFAFQASDTIAPPKPPKKLTTIRALPEREAGIEIRFPRVVGYRVTLPSDRLTAKFDHNSKLTITPNDIPSRTENEGIVGEGTTLTLESLQKLRPQEVYFHVAALAMNTKFRDEDGNPKPHLFPQLLAITRKWFETCLECKGGAMPQYFRWRDLAEQAVDRIYAAVTAGLSGEEKLRPILDSYNPESSSKHVLFQTSKDNLFITKPEMCHVNFVVCDSDWEAGLAENLEAMKDIVIRYVKNQSLGFEVPYVLLGQERLYLPDYIVQVDDGHGRENPLNLIIEVKGFRGRDVQIKESTITNMWVPAVNNHGGFGRWAFLEIRDIMDAEKLIRDFVAKQHNLELKVA